MRNFLLIRAKKVNIYAPINAMKKIFLTLLFGLMTSEYAGAIILIPLPNLGFPPGIGKIRDALEKSTDTKALATVGEDKTFGARQWAYGQASGKITQADADALALSRCEAGLKNLKGQVAGGQPLYDFGNNKCELYKFRNVTLNLPDLAPAPPPPPAAVPPAALTAEPPPPPAAAPPVETKIKVDIVQKMRDLDSLLKQGLINQDDYDRKKTQLLGEM